MTMGCSVRYGGGEPPVTLSRLNPRENRGTFAPAEPTHTCTQSLPHPSSVQPTVDSRRRLARGVTRSGGLRCSTSWQACTVRETASGVRYGSLPAFLRKRGGYRTPRESKDAHGKRGPTHRHGLIQKRALRSRRARIGRSRSCSRVVECCRSRQTVAGAEKRTLSISPDLDSVQGRAPSSQLHVRKYAATGEETLAPSSRRKPSCDRFREWVRTRAWRGALAMEGILDRRGSRLFTERLHVTVSAYSADLEPRASEVRAPR